MKRRELLALAAAGATLIRPKSASAFRRANYGGALRLSLPLSLSQLDPHAPESLACGLFGSSLFESLYERTAQGQPYSTLAARNPEDHGSFFQVELRPELKFSDGSSLTAREVVSSILRSQSLSSQLVGLGKPTASRTNPLIVHFPKPKGSQLTENDLALELARPRSAIVPLSFSPTTPVGCGALKVTRIGPRLTLSRNELAPRGGSFLATVEIRSVSVTDALRAFESRSVDLGFLGKGLHRPRKDATAFQLSPLGLVIVQVGRGAEAFARPGLLHSQLARIPHAPFAALATARVRTSPVKWTGPSLSLLVDEQEYWLLALAKELSQSWSASGSELKVEAVSRVALTQRARSRDFDLILNAISTSGINTDQASRDLFALDGRSPPLGGRMPPPEEACRQLSLGLLGELRPHGAIAPEFLDLVAPGPELDFANAQRARE